MKSVILLAFIFGCALGMLVLHFYQPKLIDANSIVNEAPKLAKSKPNAKFPNQVYLSKTIHTQALRSFAGKPLENINSKKYKNFFRASVQSQGKIFRWHKSHLTYAIDLATKRKITKSKVRRAFQVWQKKSKIFTFSEAPRRQKADIFIMVASPSQKNRMGEAGPDEAYQVGTIELDGRLIDEFVIKHAQITIASDFFDYDKLRQYRQNQTDHGFQTLVHELGHVLGIMGHSPNYGDCMYFQAHPSGKACDELTPEINTLAIIYGRPESLTRGFYRQKNLKY